MASLLALNDPIQLLGAWSCGLSLSTKWGPFAVPPLVQVTSSVTTTVLGEMKIVLLLVLSSLWLGG
jgi:hypothetical protein